MRKISREDYNEFKRHFQSVVDSGALPSRKYQKQSKKRALYYANWAKKMNIHIETVRRAARSKNYAEYLRLGRENRGTSTKRKSIAKEYKGRMLESTLDSTLQLMDDTFMPYEKVFPYVKPEVPSEPKPKKYKTTIISTKPFLVGQQRFDLANENGELESYTVEVLQ